MAKAKINLEAPMLRIKIGYKHMVLPWAEGMLVFNALKDARFMEVSYAGGVTGWEPEKEEVSCHIFTPEEQAMLLMEGDANEHLD